MNFKHDIKPASIVLKTSIRATFIWFFLPSKKPLLWSDQYRFKFLSDRTKQTQLYATFKAKSPECIMEKKHLTSPSLINIPPQSPSTMHLPFCEWQHSVGRWISLFSCWNILMCHQSGSSFLAQRNTKPEPNTGTRSLSEG